MIKYFKNTNMKKLAFILISIALFSNSSKGQKYITKEGIIEIFSQTSLFTIEAKNQKVASILNSENGEIVSSTLVRSFKFKEALVEEHFNENYMESHEFPKSVFKGKITNFSNVDLKKNGTYNITIEGALTMHGETHPLKTEGKLIVNGDNIKANTEFLISLEKYKIEVEENYKDRIKDEIKLIVHFNYSKMNK